MQYVQRWVIALAAVSAVALPVITAAGTTAANVPRAVVSGLPLSFEAAAARPGESADFVAHGPQYAIGLNEQGARLYVGSDEIRLKMLNARAAKPSAEQPLPGIVNYYIGNDPIKWRTGVKTFAQVRYPGVYPGIDLVYYGTQGRLEYDFAVAPGASAAPIRLAFAGADEVKLDAQGDLHVTRDGHAVVFEHPVAYQMNAGRRAAVAARYELHGETVRFELGAYDHHRRLIIDPVLSYLSYLGGNNSDVVGEGCPSCDYLAGQAAGVDAAGDLYIAGYTESTNFPTQSPYAPIPTKTSGVEWAFVSKFAPDAKTLIFSTYLGGTLGNDTAAGLALDASGNAFVVGQAGSNDFPVTSGAYQTLCSPNYTNNAAGFSNCSGTNGQASAWVSKFGPTGALLASTFLGGTQSSVASAVATDSAGRAYVTGSTIPGANIAQNGGQTKTVGFPTTSGALQGQPAGLTSGVGAYIGFSQDAYVSVFDPTLATLIYSTLFGDTQIYNPNATQYDGYTYGTAVAVDASGNFYIAGYGQDGNLPITAGALLTSIGSAASSSTSCGVLYPNNGNILSGACSFVAKFSPVGGAAAPTQIYGTYLGHLLTAGGGIDEATGIVADAAGNAYVTGFANQAAFPTTAGAYQATCDLYTGQSGENNSDCNAAFIAKINPTGTAILAATYIGGLNAGQNNISDNIAVIGPITLDAGGNVYVAGTAANGFPQVNGLGTSNAFGTSPFVAEFDATLSTLKFSTLFSNGAGGQLSLNGLGLDGAGAIYLAGSVNTLSASAATAGAFQTSFGGGSSDAFVAKIVVQTATQTSLSATPTSASAGTAINFTATVAEVGGTGVPTGAVTFKDGTTTLGSLTLNATGVAVFSTTTLAAGTHSVTAAYAGDAANAASTSTAAAVTVTAAAAPTVTIHAAPTSVVVGQSAMLTWSSTNATACTASGAWTGSQMVSGSATLTPTAAGSLSYVLTCTGSGGSANAAAALTVTALPAAPTVTIAAAPASIVLGKSATLTWSSTNATACTASGSWTGSQMVSGSATLTPTAAASLSYVLTCTGSGGSGSATAALTVTAPAPTVTIAVAPTTITAGQSAALTWSSTNATACTASGAWSGTQATSGTATKSPSATGTSTFTLTCTGSGGSGNASAALTVNAAGKHGGGAIGVWELLGLSSLCLLAYRRRARAP